MLILPRRFSDPGFSAIPTSWESVPTMPASKPMWIQGSFMLNGNPHFFDRNTSVAGDESVNIYEFDLVSKTWSSFDLDILSPALPNSVSSSGCLLDNGDIFFSYGPDTSSAITSWARYTPSTKSVVTGLSSGTPPLDVNQFENYVTGPNGHVYAVCLELNSQGDARDASWEFNTTTNTWTLLGLKSDQVPVVEPNSQGISVLLDDGRIFFGGGEGAGETKQTKHWYYDTSTDNYTEISPQQTDLDSREGAMAVKLQDGRVARFGGAYDGNRQSVGNEMWIFDPSDDSWTLNSLQVPTNIGAYTHAPILLPDGRVFLAGGAPHTNSYLGIH